MAVALTFLALASFGFAYIAGHARITLFWRESIAEHGGKAGEWLLNLIECPACLSFWIGLAAGLSYGLGVGALGLGCFTTATSFILGRMTGLMKE